MTNNMTNNITRRLNNILRLPVALLLLLSMTLIIPTGQAQTQANSPGLDAFHHFFNAINTLEAKFVQVVLDENLTPLDDGHGTLWIKRPGRFRWNYDPPDAQEIVGDGERVWLYDIALEQVTVRDQAATLGRTPAILLAGSGDLANTYRLDDLGVQGQVHWVNLIPEDAQSDFTEVRIGFENGHLRLMELVDTLDQLTRISFVDIKENTPLALHLFEFVLPAGIDVIDQSNQ